MPLPDHVVNAHKGSGGNGTGEQRAVKSERRRAIRESRSEQKDRR